MKKPPGFPRAAFSVQCSAVLALTGFKAALRLIDDVHAALTANDTTIAMPVLQRAE